MAGAGSGLTNPPLASAAIGTVGEERAGVGSGVNNTARQIGIAAGIAALGAIFQSRVQTAMSDGLSRHAAFVSGFDRILWVGAAISIAGAALALVLVRQGDAEVRAAAGSSSPVM